MKKILAITALFFMAVTAEPKAEAQVNIQINIGSQPAWGPTGYDYAQFYYFPDYNFYYDIARAQYIVFRNNVWAYMRTVPGSFGFDPYNAYKVVINKNKPYLYNDAHQKEYMQYKAHGAQQPMIRDSKEHKYFESKGHPRHSEWQAGNNRQGQQNNSGQNNSGQNPRQNPAPSGNGPGRNSANSPGTQDSTNPRRNEDNRINNGDKVNARNPNAANGSGNSRR